MRRTMLLAMVFAIGSLSIVAATFQQPPAQQGPKVVEVEKLKDNLFMLKGGGGNTAVFIASTGVIVVDTKNPGWGQPILDKIKELTNKPITTIINTHTHGDHVSGNVEFPATVDVIVQANTKANMEKMTPPPVCRSRGHRRTSSRSTMVEVWQKGPLTTRCRLGKGPDEIDLFYFGRGHTNGDAWVVFRRFESCTPATSFPEKTFRSWTRRMAAAALPSGIRS